MSETRESTVRMVVNVDLVVEARIKIKANDDNLEKRILAWAAGDDEQGYCTLENMVSICGDAVELSECLERAIGDQSCYVKTFTRE